MHRRRNGYWDSKGGAAINNWVDILDATLQKSGWQSAGLTHQQEAKRGETGICTRTWIELVKP